MREKYPNDPVRLLWDLHTGYLAAGELNVKVVEDSGAVVPKKQDDAYAGFNSYSMMDCICFDHHVFGCMAINAGYRANWLRFYIVSYLNCLRKDGFMAIRFDDAEKIIVSPEDVMSTLLKGLPCTYNFRTLTECWHDDDFKQPILLLVKKSYKHFEYDTCDVKVVIIKKTGDIIDEHFDHVFDDRCSIKTGAEGTSKVVDTAKKTSASGNKKKKKDRSFL